MPNANVLNQKKAKVAEIVELLKGSTAGVLVDYSGITVEDDTKLRKELREGRSKILRREEHPSQARHERNRLRGTYRRAQRNHRYRGIRR